MRPKKHETTGSSDLFRARLEQIINMKHELVQLAGKIDWDWLDREIAPLYSDKGRPGIETRFVLGLLLLKHIYALSDEGVCDRWVYDPYFQHFTGEEFFQHVFPHERSDLTHWRNRLGDKLDCCWPKPTATSTAVSAQTRTNALSRSTCWKPFPCGLAGGDSRAGAGWLAGRAAGRRRASTAAKTRNDAASAR